MRAIQRETNLRWLEVDGKWGLFDVSPKHEWVGLTDEDLEPMCDDWRIVLGSYVHDFAKAIEAKLKEKNCG